MIGSGSWTKLLIRKASRGHRTRIGRFFETLAAVISMMGVVGSCADDRDLRDSGAPCLSVAEARICAQVDRGRLVMTAEGLEAGSLLRISMEGIGPAEWMVSETGTLIQEAGSIGFLSYNGTFGEISVEAISKNGSPVVGRIVPD